MRFSLGRDIVGDVVSGSPVKILLVEDEPPLLQLIEKYLQRLGFEVETHLKSFDALRNFEAAPDRYGMVIADLGMPDLPGDTLLTRMLEIRPDLRILVCSGSPFFIENLPRFAAAASGVSAEAVRAQNAGRSGAEFAQERPGNPSATMLNYSATAVSA